ncbi:MAG TPA: class I SAM-dependent methyltransferase [Anaerolineales bacterium]|nr:class I SAM-dependent methyltransferase [Anaerolineales bacterium]
MTSSFDPEGFEPAALAAVPELSGARVLEIGAGDGRLTWQYAARTRSVVGLDPDGEALAYLLEDMPPLLHRQVWPVRAASEFLPFSSERFDAALLAWSL